MTSTEYIFKIVCVNLSLDQEIFTLTVDNSYQNVVNAIKPLIAQAIDEDERLDLVKNLIEALPSP